MTENKLLRDVYAEFLIVKDAEERARRSLHGFTFPSFQVPAGEVSLIVDGRVEFLETGRSRVAFNIGEARAMAHWILEHTDEED